MLSQTLRRRSMMRMWWSLSKFYSFKWLGFRRPTAVKTLAGSSGDDQSGRWSVRIEIQCRETIKLFPDFGLFFNFLFKIFVSSKLVFFNFFSNFFFKFFSKKNSTFFFQNLFQNFFQNFFSKIFSFFFGLQRSTGKTSHTRDPESTEGKTSPTHAGVPNGSSIPLND